MSSWAGSVGVWREVDGLGNMGEYMRIWLKGIEHTLGAF